MPTSQSASLRDRAAASRSASCSPGRSFSNPSRMACFVIEEIQSRSTGFGSGGAFFLRFGFSPFASPSSSGAGLNAVS